MVTAFLMVNYTSTLGEANKKQMNLLEDILE